MKTNETSAQGLSRRSFFKMGAGAAALAGVTALAGCAPKSSSSKATTAEAAQADGATASAAGADAAVATVVDPLAAPAAITDIKETHDYDIVVVGLGMSGAACALAAVEGGAKVAVLQKGEMCLTHGNFCAVINSPEFTEAGCETIDVDAMMKQFNTSNNNLINWSLVRRYFQESPESGSWILKKAEEAGVKAIIPAPIPAVKFEGKQIAGAKGMADLAEKKGAEMFFNCPGVQLVVDGSGAVTGVIGESAQGYIQFNAKKGVVLATGDYGNNRDMLAKWCPGALPFENFYNPPYNDGEGHLMGLWAGARMQEAPHPKMVHVHHYVGDGDKNAPMRKAPWLNVNDYGDRFMDESTLYEHRCNQAVKYPDVHATQIFDGNYEQYYAQMPNQVDPANDGTLEDFIEWGMAFKADTIEELAAAADFPADHLKATVERYNELVAGGRDDDYMKPMEFMYPIDTPPFYAIRRQYVISVITGGLEVDENCNVVDEQWNPIPGLYAVGNVQGGMFGGTDYPFDITGLSLGRAMTFGYVVGRDLAKA